MIKLEVRERATKQSKHAFFFLAAINAQKLSE